jgi:hypothetical protein
MDKTKYDDLDDDTEGGDHFACYNGFHKLSSEARERLSKTAKRLGVEHIYNFEGDDNTVSYRFCDEGGHTVMLKKYTAHHQEKGKMIQKMPEKTITIQEEKSETVKKPLLMMLSQKIISESIKGIVVISSICENISKFTHAIEWNTGCIIVQNPCLFDLMSTESKYNIDILLSTSDTCLINVGSNVELSLYAAPGNSRAIHKRRYYPGDIKTKKMVQCIVNKFGRSDKKSQSKIYLVIDFLDCILLLINK